VMGVGTRWTDFTTASRTGFPKAALISVNVAEPDAAKHGGLAVVGDARCVLDMLHSLAYRVSDAYAAEVAAAAREWHDEVDRLTSLGHEPRPAQSEVIGAVNAAAGQRGIVVCAAGSMPSDLHKLWRTSDPKGYHVEYGYSAMGYEIAGALGVKMAAPEREVFVMVGDGSYLMLSEAIVTSIAEDAKLTIVLVDNQGYGSIGSLSRSLGTEGFGTAYPPTDLAANAESLGAIVLRAHSIAELRDALKEAGEAERTEVVHVAVDADPAVPGYGSWWDVPVAEVSTGDAVQAARQEYDNARSRRL